MDTNLPSRATNRRQLGDDSGGFSLKDALNIIRRRKLSIVVTVVFCTALTAMISSQLTPRYTATSTVMIEPRKVSVIDLNTVTEELPVDNATIDTQIRVLTSVRHAHRIVEELRLLDDPEFNPTAPSRHPTVDMVGTFQNWLADGWLTAAGLAGPFLPQELHPVPPPPPAATGLARALPEPGDEAKAEAEQRLQAVTAHLLENLEVLKDGRSYVILINYTSVDPAKAAAIANAAAERYVEAQLEEKLATTMEATSWLAERAEQLREKVLASERAIQQYEATHELVDSPGVALNSQQLASLNSELIAARAEGWAKSARLNRIRQLMESDGGYEALAKVMSSPAIVSLRQQQDGLLRQEAQLSKEYGPQHPKIRQLQAEKENIAAAVDREVGNEILQLENELTVARSREAALQENLQAAKVQLAAISQAEIPLREYEREAAADRSLYATFLARLKETEQQQDLLRAGAQVLSAATIPLAPSFPKPKLMTAAAFTMSLLLATLLAFLLEHLDSRLRTRRQLEETLGIPSFGLVPFVGRRDAGSKKPHEYLVENPLSAYADAIRAVRKAIQLSNKTRPPQVVLVTSTLPDEGKTTLALSLAASAARSGLKAVVVDVDLRNPSVCRELDGTADPGLVDFLNGEARLEEILHTDPRLSNLDFVPVSRLFSDSVDLLESPKMASLVSLLRARYEYIVLDSPPALGFTDTKVTALLADAVLFAIRWEKTCGEMARNGLEALADSTVSATGLVLTQVKLRRHARYGYGDVGQYYGKYRKQYAA